MQLASCVMLTSDGELELFKPVVDDDHTDIAVGRQGMVAELAIQTKTALSLDRQGRVVARSDFPTDQIRERARFVYVIVYIVEAAIATGWIVPSADFNRIAYHVSRLHGGVELEFIAYPDRDDRWAPYRCRRMDLGARLLDLVRSLPPGVAPIFPDAHMLLRSGSSR